MNTHTQINDNTSAKDTEVLFCNVLIMMSCFKGSFNFKCIFGDFNELL
jgi:hypothetical protein